MRLELCIERLAAGGEGVGRAPDGRAVFVPFTAPGDRVCVRIERSRRRFAHARVEALLEPGPDRVTPRCAVFGTCGGCAWQHLAYPAQLVAKAQIVRDALQRIAGLPWPAPIAVAASPSAYGYRARTRVLCQDGRVGYRGRRSRALCEVQHCPVLDSAVERALERLVANPPECAGEWELAGVGAARALPLPAQDGPCIALEVGGDRLRISPGVFFQANAGLHETLLRAVLGAAGRGARALELFAGAGFLTLSLARRFERVTAVESSAAAAADLAYNLAGAGIANVEILAERVERLSAAALGAPAVVVLDPPRSGLPPGVAAALARCRPARIVYLSCDPATLARDIRALRGDGYAPSRVDAFDLFPQTPHIETLAVLEPAAGCAAR
jgi:23S rRNA (uracil1939-C5)-methyltransferase